nr:A284 [uncultured bacterium]ART37349.1 E26 [uncultured bacterium]
MIRFDRFAPSGGDLTASVTLPFERRARSRQRVVLDDDREALIDLPRGTVLRDGNLLADAQGQVLAVCAAREGVSIARAADPLVLLRGAYHLGNRHIAVQLGPGWVRYLHDHVLDDMLRGLGLDVDFAQLPFEPEAGAYGPGAVSGHAHAHGYD